MKTLIIFLFVALSLTACATPKPIIITSGAFDRLRKSSILDLRLEKVVLPRIKMETALRQLADGISSSTRRKMAFSYGVENSRDPMDRLPRKNPVVYFEGSDLPLKKVLDDLCRQAGWSYTETPVGIMFIDDRRYGKGSPP